MQQPLVGQGLLIIEALRLQSEAPHSVGLLWTSDQPVEQTSMPPAGFEPTIPVSQRLQTHALGRAATGTDTYFIPKYI